MDPKAIGLIMQGGGALGAYEYGAVTCLLDHGFKPVVVSGVSIGAINSAVIAGARGGDAKARLQELWRRISLSPMPFLPADQQATLSMFGNPGFWRSRLDMHNLFSWTSLCDVSPMYDTLRDVVDFDRINQPDPAVRIAVTATCVETGDSVRFSNCQPDDADKPDKSIRAVKTMTKITPEHIMASGSLPPGFPMTKIGSRHYWDGGLFDNTPVRPLLEMLSDDEAADLPIVVLSLFPMNGRVPTSMIEAQTRQLEITYESRFWADYGGSQGAEDYADVLAWLQHVVPREHPIRNEPQFKRMMLYRGLKNLHVVSNGSVALSGGMDFSQHGVQRRFEDGYEMMRHHLDEHGGKLSRPATGVAERRAAAEPRKAAE